MESSIPPNLVVITMPFKNIAEGDVCQKSRFISDLV